MSSPTLALLTVIGVASQVGVTWAIKPALPFLSIMYDMAPIESPAGTFRTGHLRRNDLVVVHHLDHLAGEDVLPTSDRIVGDDLDRAGRAAPPPEPDLPHAAIPSSASIAMVMVRSFLKRTMSVPS